VQGFRPAGERRVLSRITGSVHQTKGKAMRRMVVAVTASAVVASGMILASPGLARADSSCTGVSDFTLSPSVGDGITAIPTIGNVTHQANCDLAIGSSNGAVTALQRSINKCYGYTLALDGIYGSQTQAAVEHVQSVSGISVDGIYGPQTRNAMKWEDTASIGCSKLKQPLQSA
jgi:hypothetical protein